MELNIPQIISVYNHHKYSGRGVDALDKDKMLSACLGCRACEEVCPQGIKISEMMSDFAERLKK